MQQVRVISLVADFAKPGELKSVIEEHLAANHYHILVNNTEVLLVTTIDADLEVFRIAFNQHLICNQI